MKKNIDVKLKQLFGYVVRFKSSTLSGRDFGGIVSRIDIDGTVFFDEIDCEGLAPIGIPFESMEVLELAGVEVQELEDGFYRKF